MVDGYGDDGDDEYGGYVEFLVSSCSWAGEFASSAAAVVYDRTSLMALPSFPPLSLVWISRLVTLMVYWWRLSIYVVMLPGLPFPGLNSGLQVCEILPRMVMVVRLLLGLEFNVTVARVDRMSELCM